MLRRLCGTQTSYVENWMETKETFERKGYYIILGVDGGDTMYFGLKDSESFHKSVQAILNANIRADIKVKQEEE